MYDNIGGKIKTLAKGIFIVESISFVIGGIAFMAIDSEFIVYGLLLLFFGPLVAWVSSWITYGFGELIEKVTEIESNTRSGVLNKNPKSGCSVKTNALSTKTNIKIRIPDDKADIKSKSITDEIYEDDYIDFLCPKCEHTLSVSKSTDALNCPYCEQKIYIGEN